MSPGASRSIQSVGMQAKPANSGHMNNTAAHTPTYYVVSSALCVSKVGKDAHGIGCEANDLESARATLPKEQVISTPAAHKGGGMKS